MAENKKVTILTEEEFDRVKDICLDNMRKTIDGEEKGIAGMMMVITATVFASDLKHLLFDTEDTSDN